MMRLFFGRLCHLPIPLCADITLVALFLLARSGAFCGEIHDAAQSGNLAKVKGTLNT